MAAAACQHPDPCFTPQSRVTDLRVLGISVDPPDPVADLATGTVEPVRLRALIVDPQGSRGTYQVSWALCVAATDNPGCSGAAVVATNPEWRRDSSVELRVPPGLIAAAVAADPLRGFGGMRVLAELRVEGAKPQAATTPIIFTQKLAQPRNQPPVMDGLRFTPQGESTLEAPPPPATMEIVVAQPTGLRPVLAPGAMEEYDTVDLAGHTVHLQERIRYSFYVTPGLNIGRILLRSVGGSVVSFGNGSDVEADEPPPGTPDPPGGLILLEAVERGGGQGTLWIVARDSRGATSWLEQPVSSVEVDPNCLGPPPLRGCAQLDFGCF
ncbi:MAG: hypothetical protein E6J85_09130 [Deltaproteobacteria bacterium]|nr:MAG: hypothetical protein E6J85_09130 [Deltaproteobacteria bacterium]TMB29440.1 MAG: hypothetical protein E6J61_15380 [Deltaproteobacteria bacterium]